MVTGNLKGRKKEQKARKQSCKAEKRRGNARTCDMMKGSKRRQTIKKFRRRKRGAKRESR